MKIRYCVGIALMAFVCMHLATLYDRSSMALAAPNDSEPARAQLEATCEGDEVISSNDEIRKTFTEEDYKALVVDEIVDGTHEDVLAGFYQDKINDEVDQWNDELQSRYDEGLLLVNLAENWVEETF